MIVLGIILVLQGKQTGPTIAVSENCFKNILMEACLLYYLFCFY